MAELAHNSFQVLCIEMLFSFSRLFERLAQTSENACLNNEGSYEASVIKNTEEKIQGKNLTQTEVLMLIFSVLKNVIAYSALVFTR